MKPLTLFICLLMAGCCSENNKPLKKPFTVIRKEGDFGSYRYTFQDANGQIITFWEEDLNIHQIGDTL